MILAWPDEEPIEAFATKLAEQYALRPLEEQDALAVQEIAAPYNRELSVLAAEYNEAIDQAFQERFRSGTFVKAPFATHGVTRPEDLGGFHTKLSSMGGWHTIVSLRSEDYPYLMDLRDRAQQLVERRDLDVKRALRERGY